MILQTEGYIRGYVGYPKENAVINSNKILELNMKKMINIFNKLYGGPNEAAIDLGKMESMGAMDDFYTFH